MLPAHDVAAARPVAEQSLELWSENGDPLELAIALEGIGWLHFAARNYSEALHSIEDCVESYRKLGSTKLITRGRVAVGQMLVALGDVERTEPLARETLAEGRAQGEPKFVHYSLHYLADCALWRSDARSAVSLYGESLRAALDYGNEMEAATEMQGMAMGLMGSGREAEGLRLYGASNARYKEVQTTMVRRGRVLVEVSRTLPATGAGTNGSGCLREGGTRRVGDRLGASVGVCLRVSGLRGLKSSGAFEPGFRRRDLCRGSAQERQKSCL